MLPDINLLLATNPRPAFIGATENLVGSASSLTLTPHASTQTGDLLLALLNSDDGAAWNTTSGWTEAVDQAAAPGLGLQYFEHDGSGSYNFTKSGASGLCGQLITCRAAAFDTVGAIGTRASGSSAAFNAGGITVAAGGGIAFCWLTTDKGGDDEGFFDGPVGYTDILYTGTNIGGNSQGKSFGANVLAGAIADQSVRIAVSSGNKAAILFSVKEQ